MFELSEVMIIRGITPIHAGCGSDLGVVDLPIQREVHTGYPKIESSGIKGCVREALEQIVYEEDLQEIYNIHNWFGYDKDSMLKIDKVKEKFDGNTQFASPIGFTDARILLFPVISAKGVFAYITSFGVINRFIEDISMIESSSINKYEVNIKDNEAHVLGSNKGKEDVKSVILNNEYVMLEEYKYECVFNENEKFKKMVQCLKNYTNIDNLEQKLVVLKDDDFKDFVTMKTEVITRTKIDDKTGTVATGSLFTEEYLPAETVMYSIVLFASTNCYITSGGEGSSVRKKAKEIMDEFKNKCRKIEVMQIGAGATIGKGIVKVIWGGKKNEC